MVSRTASSRVSSPRHHSSRTARPAATKADPYARVQQAKAAYEGCLQTAVKYQHYDENARMCEVWLSRNYGAEYHLVDELRGAPTKVAAGVGDRPLPVGLGGAFVRE